MFECVGAACICVYVAPVALFAIGAFYNSFVMQKLVECVPRLDGGLNKGPCCCSFFFLVPVHKTFPIVIKWHEVGSFFYIFSLLCGC